MKAPLHKICLAVLAALLLAAPAAAAQPVPVERALQQAHRKADERRGALRQLKAREQELAGRLGDILVRTKAAEASIATRQAGLDAIRAQEADSAKRYAAIRGRRERTLRELKRLVAVLWPVEARGVQEGAHFSGAWAAADRQFQWNSAVYVRARAKLVEARRQERELAAVLARQRALAAAEDRQLAAVNAAKDSLLRDRLTVNARMNEVSSRRRDLEGELQDIFKTIRQLNYQLRSLRNRKFASSRGSLPWPAAGRLVVRYAPGGRLSRRGVGLATGSRAAVRSMFWGKVVHCDVLRGLGRVIIIYHGDDYYSLYAYLADTTVATGQEVQQGETLGHAGYYPEARGPGVYFELRFHQKPINPLMWLAPAK